MSGQQATLALLHASHTRKNQRFADAGDFDRYLHLLVTLLERVPAHRLELSRDPGDLNHLIARLGLEHPAAHSRR